MTDDTGPRADRRPRRAALLLLGALALTALLHAAIGLAPPVLYGLAGGLALSLVILARDALRTRERGHQPPDRDR